MLNYFKLLGLPEQPVTDRRRLQEAYVTALRAVHPDHHQANEDLVAKTADAGIVNAAFQTLKSRLTSVSHYLAVKGVLEPDEKYQLPAAILMEMMELNEMAADNPEQYLKEREAIGNNLDSEFERLNVKLQDGEPEDGTLQALKLWYFKRKYFDRLPEV